MVPLLLLFVTMMTRSLSDKVLDSLAELKVPTSNWASVYASDNTDYRQPVSEQSAYPIAEASRSDWFESYPYQKFEDKTARVADPGILETVRDTVGNTVGSVRSTVSDFGGGVVNGALRLVGAETLRDQQEKARRGKPDPLIDFSVDLSYGLPNIGYVYQGLHVRGPNYKQNEQINRDTDIPGEGNTVRPSVTEPEQAPLEKLRLGIRSYLDPLVDPMVDPIKNLLKSDTKTESQNERRQQQGFPNPISGLKDFGKHVAGGFSKLTGIAASSKVSNMLFPWMRVDNQEPIGQLGLQEPTGQLGILPPVHNTQARQLHSNILSQESDHFAHQQWPITAQDTELPLLPPVFIFPPTQDAQESDIVVQRVPAPRVEPKAEGPTQPVAHVLETLLKSLAPREFFPSRPVSPKHKVKFPAYPKKVVYPPLYPQYNIQPPPYHPNEIVDTPYPYQISITPILQTQYRSKKETTNIDYPIFGPDQLVSGSSRSLTKDLPQLGGPSGQAGYPLPIKNHNVMYYLPAPDLSTGNEKRARSLDGDLFDTQETILLPANYFDEVTSLPKFKRKVSIEIDNFDTSAKDFSEFDLDFDNSDFALLGTNIEIDLSTGSIDGVVEQSDVNQTENTNPKAFKKVRKLKPTTTINLAPTDTLVFDISEQWDDILKLDDNEIGSNPETDDVDTDSGENKSHQIDQEEKTDEEII